MTHLFYFTAILFLFFEIVLLWNPKKVLDMINRNKSKKYDEMTDTSKLYGFIQLLYLLWCLTGLLTSQWGIFLVFVVWSFIPKMNLFMRILDGIVSVLVLVFIILNKYHLHIDIFSTLFD